MKNGKLSQDPHQPKPSSSSSSKAVDLKLQQIGLTPSISVPQTVVQNPDSKTSTQDFSHKLDSSHVKIKDISHIVSESLLCDEQGAENNISEISIINMLGDGNLKHLNNEILNFDSIEDNEVLKRELEMKNRLIEKLMKENASLREEMESFLTSMEQAKDHLSTSVQDCHHKISELEHQVAQLEGENRSLKEQLARKTEEEAGRESKMHEFERRMQHYCEYTKENMEDFYLRLNQQMLALIDTSRRQHDNFSRAVRDHVEDLREEALFGNKNNMSKSQNLAHSASLPSCKLERKTATERSFDEQNFSMTQSLTLGTPRNGDYSAKNNYSGGKKLVSEGTKSRPNLNSYAKIDEGPELKMERRSSMATGRMSTLASGVKKVDNNKENIPVAKKGGVKDSGAMTKSVVKGRASMGAIGNDKKKTGV